MEEKYFFIEAETARELLELVQNTRPTKRGIDRQAYLFKDYVVLSTGRLKLRNVVFRDDDLSYFDDIIKRLSCLYDEGVHVVPVLGYCYDPRTENGNGYIFQRRAKGNELYDDATICKYEVWTQGKTDVYLKSDIDSSAYILSRTHTIANAPQAHFDKLILDIRAILSRDILIDFQGKSNFFYDEEEGFSFIDLDSHTDSFYGAGDPFDVEIETAMGGFVPCHFSQKTKAFAPFALDENAIQTIGRSGLEQLAEDNLRIFEKCKTAMRNSRISESALQTALRSIKIYGQ